MEESSSDIELNFDVERTALSPENELPWIFLKFFWVIRLNTNYVPLIQKSFN